MKRIAILITLIALCLLFVGCSRSFNVTLVFGEGRENEGVIINPRAFLPIPEAEEGYIFAGWYFDNEYVNPVISAADIECDTTIYARWLEKGGDTVTLVYGGSQTASVYTYSGSVSEPKPPVRDKYNFVCWSLTEDGKEPYAFGAASEGNIVLYAIWEYEPTPTLTLHRNNGEDKISYTVDWGFELSDYLLPSYEGHSFGGWYLDPDFTTPVNEDMRITGDTELYALWIPSFEDFANNLATEALKSSVKILHRKYNTGLFGSVTDQSASQGSGVIYKAEDTVYYVLTNHHVIERETEYSHSEYTVVDSYGVSHNATLVANDAAYDLAVLRFSYSDATLPAVAFAGDTEPAGALVASVGCPGGLTNSVSYGSIHSYYNLTTDSIDFEVACHTCPIDKGSSGGGVFNTQGELVGINYAGGVDDDGTDYGFFIPIDRVREFLLSNSL